MGTIKDKANSTLNRAYKGIQEFQSNAFSSHIKAHEDTLAKERVYEEIDLKQLDDLEKLALEALEDI